MEEGPAAAERKEKGDHRMTCSHPVSAATPGLDPLVPHAALEVGVAEQVDVGARAVVVTEHLCEYDA